jgi:hypothetical protein
MGLRATLTTVSAIAGAAAVMAHTGVAEKWVSFQGGVTLGPNRVHNAMFAPVRGYFSELLEATYGPASQEQAHYERARNRYLTSRARAQLLRNDVPRASANNRLLWTNAVDLQSLGVTDSPRVALNIDDTSSDDLFSFTFALSEARVGLADDDARIITRGATTGCKLLDGDFTVVPRAGRWVIDELPVQRPCRTPDDENLAALRESWTYVPPPKGRSFGSYGGPSDPTIPRWARGNLQRVEAFAGGASDPDYPPELVADRDGRATAWRSMPGRGPGSTLTFGFPSPIRLAIVKIRNGTGDNASLARNGRVAIASLTVNGREFWMLLPDRPEEYELHCDFGVSDHAVLTVRSVYPQGTTQPTLKSGPDTFVATALAGADDAGVSSNASVRDVSFFGVRARPDSFTAASNLPPEPVPRPHLRTDHTYAAICPHDDPRTLVEYRLPVGNERNAPFAFPAETWGALGYSTATAPDDTTVRAAGPENPLAGPTTP